MKSRLLLVFLLLLSGALTFAQDQPKNPYEGKVSKFVMIGSTHLNPVKSLTYDKLAARFIKAAEESKADVNWIAAAPMTGEGYTISYLTFANTYAELDAQGAAFEKIGKEIAMKDAALLTESAEAETTWNSELIEFQPKLSYKPDAIPGAQITRWMVTRYNLNPGTFRHFAELVGEVKDLYAGIPDSNAHWIAYRTVAGAHPAVLIVRPMKSLAEMDEENPAVEKAFTKVIVAHLDDVVRKTVKSVESNIYVARPELSRPPQSYVTENPAFWAPKPTEPMAAPAAKGKKAAKAEPKK